MPIIRATKMRTPVGSRRTVGMVESGWPVQTRGDRCRGAQRLSSCGLLRVMGEIGLGHLGSEAGEQAFEGGDIVVWPQGQLLLHGCDMVRAHLPERRGTLAGKSDNAGATVSGIRFADDEPLLLQGRNMPRDSGDIQAGDGRQLGEASGTLLQPGEKPGRPWVNTGHHLTLTHTNEVSEG